MVKVTFDYGNKEDHKLVAEMIGADKEVTPAKVGKLKAEKPKPPAPDTPAPEPVQEEKVEPVAEAPTGEVIDFVDFQTAVGKKMQAGANVKAALDGMGVPTLSAIEETRRSEFLESLEA